VSTPYSPYDPGQQQGGNDPQGGYSAQGGNAPQGSYPPPQGGYSPQGGGYAPYPQQQGGYAPAGDPRGYLQGGPVGFTDAIKLAFQNIFEYKGRASRSAYWWFALAELIGWVGVVILAVIFAAVHVPALSILLYLAAIVAAFLLGLSLTIRRLHDQDKSGFWYFIGFVPFIGGIWLLVLMVMEGTPGPNRFG
jgi:uncharacterized membrane protein YhaH (DUF805 family)